MPAAAAAPTVAPSPARAAAPSRTTSTPTPQPTATPAPAPSTSSAETVWVGNTDGEGVYLRASPRLTDRQRAYADGTPLTIIGEDVEGEGQQWHHVRAPDGAEGYVPTVYTVDTEP